MGLAGAREWVIPRRELCGNAEDTVDEFTLSYRITFGDPAHLTLADCVHRFVTLDGSARTVRRSESEARRNPLLINSVCLSRSDRRA